MTLPPDTKDVPALASREAFRSAMAAVGAAVNVVTTDGPAGRSAFTATAVCSVSDSPPTLLVCLNRAASVHAAVTANQKLCVNTLAAEQQDIAALFSGGQGTPMEQRFAAASWTQARDGSPRLNGALTRIECTVTETVTVGTHDVLFCTVHAVDVEHSKTALIYFDRRFHTVVSALPAESEAS